MIQIRWRNWNDQLSLLVMGAILVMWGISGAGWITLPAEVTGALIVVFTLIAQFYFRRSEPTPPTP